MPIQRTKFGPGTLTLDPAGNLTGQAGPMEISCQVSSGGVTHEYEDTDDPQTVLCGDSTEGNTERRDGLTFDHLADLTASGVYAFLLANDLQACEFEYVPNTASGATWAGSVQLRLPDGVQADEFGSPLSGSVTWPGVGVFAFTPGV